jgi:hypothetical protein
MPCTSGSRPAWCRLPATTCRCNTPPASLPSICIRASRPGCSTSPTWARRSPDGPRSRKRRASHRAAGPGRYSGAGTGADPLQPVDQRRRRHHRRPDDHTRHRGRQAHAGGQRLAQGGGLRLAAPEPRGCLAVEPVEDRALIALQGPKAAEVMGRHCAEAVDLAFMTAAHASFDGIDCVVSRSGYTGEDGFEISVPMRAAPAALCRSAAGRRGEVKPIGLGARDSLRLEAGLCLYGHDIDETTSPVEAACVVDRQAPAQRRGVSWAPSASCASSTNGPARKRVGIRPEGRARRARARRSTPKDGAAIGTSHLRRLRPHGRRADRHGLCRAEAAKPATRR